MSAVQGVNRVSICKIVDEDKLVTTEEAFLSIKDEALHPTLRSAYIDFIISTLVDMNIDQSGETISNIGYTFVSLSHTQYLLQVLHFCCCFHKLLFLDGVVLK